MFDMTEEDVIEFIKDFEPGDEVWNIVAAWKNWHSEGIDIDKTSLSRECLICHYWYFKDLKFKFKPTVCNECSIGRVFSKTKNIVILNVKGIDYRCMLWGIGKNKAVNILNKSVLEDKDVIILYNSVLKDRHVL